MGEIINIYREDNNVSFLINERIDNDCLLETIKNNIVNIFTYSKNLISTLIYQSLFVFINDEKVFFYDNKSQQEGDFFLNHVSFNLISKEINKLVKERKNFTVLWNDVFNNNNDIKVSSISDINNG